MRTTMNEASFRQASGNMTNLFDKVATVAKARAMKKAARPGLVAARRIAKGIPALNGNTKALRLAVKSYRGNKLTLAYAGWDSKIPVHWLGKLYKSSNHGNRIEFGGTVTRKGEKVRTQPYAVLRKSFEAEKAGMEKIFVDALREFSMKEAAKLNR
jgi:hypothetical protein